MQCETMRGVGRQRPGARLGHEARGQEPVLALPREGSNFCNKLLLTRKDSTRYQTLTRKDGDSWCLLRVNTSV